MSKKALMFIWIGILMMSANAQIVLEGNISSNRTLTANNSYLLRGFVRVDSLVTLTIQPGTVIFGETATQGSLIIKPGGKIEASGTKEKPIVFTSEFAKQGSSRAPRYGDWGGVIILGNAPINVPGGRAAIEGPGDAYGGSNPNDNSGTLRYVRIEYPGIAFSPNNEINGLTFGGVGSGTTVEYVQVSYSGDDSFEWFGGNVNCKYLIAHRGWDDDFDSDFGYSGKLQYLVAIRDPLIADQSQSNGFESDNDGTGSSNTPLTAPTWWNVTMIGPKAASSTTVNSLYRRGMHLRRNSQNKIGNAVIMGWPTGILLDRSGTINGAINGTNYIKNSIIAGATTKAVDTTGSPNLSWDPAAWFTTTNSGRILTENSAVMLNDPFNLTAPGLTAKAGSPVLTGAAAVPADPFFDTRGSNHVGAFDSTDWTMGWANWNPVNYVVTNVSGQVVLEGNISTSRTLTADKSYLLRGFVRVDSLVTLTIEPGTIIFGETATQGSLIIKPGGKIQAAGTKEKPIIFTSEFTKQGSSRAPRYGDWGGVIILGNAPINVPGGRAAIEGPGDAYGGSNPNDNSGTLKYVRIEYPGIAFSPNNEINGLTFGGVGSGTTVEYVQVSYSGDDSFEWFGGNVNAKYLIAFRGWDDDFDTDFGFNGKLQFLVAMRDPLIADQSQSNGFESDNDGTGSSNTPLTAPTWWNVTMVGPKATDATTINSLYRRGMHLRRNSQNKIGNSVIVGWPTGVLLDRSGTINGAINGTNYLKNSIIAGATTKAIDTTGSPNLSWDPAAWFTTTNSGRILTTSAELMLNDPFNLAAPSFTAKSGSPVLTGGTAVPADPFFEARGSNFVGAFDSTDWTMGWANFNPANYILTDVKEINSGSTVVPDKFNLMQNYPNPFNPATTITFDIAEQSDVSLVVYNMLGQQVATLFSGDLTAGRHSVNFNAAGLASGIYLYQLVTNNYTVTKKMTLLK
ncbi:MAG: T9SS type A sorting domain-containing protein [Ignavibacteriaceae bacterium]|nr:T9SS type A sorting domain-containing protein [Ignavibacteriaceae bacterium]